MSTDKVAALEAEIERLHSWDGLMELLDEHWPDDIFPTSADDSARDPGPRIVALMRWRDRLASRAEAAEAKVAAAHGASETIERELICCDAYQQGPKHLEGEHPHEICYWAGAAKAILDAALPTTGTDAS